MFRRATAGALALLLAGAALIGLPASGAQAAGSPELYPTTVSCVSGPTGNCRANIEWRTNTYGPAGSQILRRTIFSVYLQAGEILTMGSSAVGVGQGDVLVYNPGQIANDQTPALPTLVPGTNGTSCSSQRAAVGADAAMGRITSRALELAGPRSVDGSANPAGWVPCSYTAPTTGIYKAMFIGPAGINANTDGAPTGDIAMTAASNFGTQQGSSISAFDLVVRANAATATATRGRVFTYALTAFTGANGRPIDAQLFVTATTGFRYRLDTNGLDPNGFVIYGNETGFLDPEGNPLNHDVLGSNGQLSTVQGGVSLAPPQFPISFFPLADETLRALAIPLTPVAPQLDGFAFTGSISGVDARISRGGTFRMFANTHGTASVVISRDGVNFDPGNPVNRVLRRVVDPGAVEIAWDGLDNSGDPFPVGTDYQVRAGLRTGIFHFPIIDAENSVRGGPSFTLLNPPGGLCPFGNAACTTSFYDDRGYTTSVADVGTPGSVLCGTNPPSPAFSSPATGYVSTTDQRRWGAATGGNTNVSCTGAFGDAKGLDSWTAYPGQGRETALNVLPALPGIDAADDANATRLNTVLTVPAARGVLANDSGGGLAVTAYTPGTAAGGSVVVNPNGSYSYTPPPGFTGTDTFTYTITDGDGNTDTATVTITVNAPPVVVNDSGSTPVNTPLSVPTSRGVLANDTLPAGTVITSVTQPANGTLSINPDGSYVYTPNAGYIGTDAFTYTVRTTDGSTATGTLNLTVTPLPVASNDAGRTGQGQTLTVPGPGVLANDSGVGLTVTGSTQPANGTVTVNPGGGYSYTPNPGFSGFDTFTYTVTDASGATSTATVTITVDPAPAATPDTGATYEGTPLTVPAGSGLLRTDTGAGIRVTAVDDPPNGTIVWNADGSYTYTPDLGFTGTEVVSYTITDRNGVTATSTLTITVSPLPVANDDTGRTPMDTVLTVPAASGVLLNDAASTTTTVTAFDATSAQGGTVVVNPDGSYSYTPPAGFTGTDTFAYTITDGGGATDTATVTITVDPLPVANGDTVTTGAGVPVIVPVPGLLQNDTGVGITLTATTPPAHGTLVANPDGSYNYTPAPGYSGPDSFTYTITDANGRTSTATVAVTVLAGPVARPDTGATYQDTPLSVPASAGLLGNDTGSGLRVTAVGTPADGTITWNADGSYVYTPAPGFTGVDQVPYTVTDANGSTASSTLTITVTPRPIANGDTGRTRVDTPLSVPAGSGLLLNDSVPAGSVVDPAATTAPLHGTVTVAPDGGYVYTPAPGYTGADSFRYTVVTPDGTRVSARVDLTVSPVPVATDDANSTRVDTPITVAGPGVLANDSGDGIRVSEVSTGPQHGSVTVSPTGGYTYTPAAGYSGTDSFAYDIVDALGGVDTAIVTITILPVPTAAPDTASTTVDTPITVAAPGVLRNDSPGTTVLSNTAPANGTVVLNADGSYTYTPAAGFSGTDTFDYTVVDALGQTATSTVTITVTAPPQLATNDRAVAGHDQTVTIDPLANDPAAGGYDRGTLQLVDPLTGAAVGGVTVPGEGVWAVLPGGLVSFDPDPGFSGISTPISYVVDDAGGDPWTATITVTVAAAPGGASGGGLAFTGSDPTGGLLAAVLLLLAGVLLRRFGAGRRTVGSLSRGRARAADGS